MSNVKSITVKPVRGTLYTYRIESSNNPEIARTVDLTQQHGLGSCTCPNYEFVVKGNQDRAFRKHGPFPNPIDYRHGERQAEGVTSCRHIWAAEKHLMRRNVRPYLAELKDGEPKDPPGWTKLIGKIINWVF